MAHLYDPAKQACDPVYYPCMNCDECGVGPGGKTTNIENNEKGILETGLQRVISRHTQAALGSNHDPMRQGIYATNSVGDND
ncbi:hypothetical protein HWB39_gp60 [Streptomyces phage WRightOn]|uniref:Uncharacterized protein n=2 Tax=Manuelvirus TaxID=2842852 RepID=A0A2H4PQX9_9CAUD|nr:hypothetical protein HWB39_gp60 [Streptomyces phage WRightOn]YP_009836075.1 hypothetical protein HWB40_gp59 [Streptomyces phage Manuel]ATW62476.1 hypothetical protein SEA_WRIGHTON_42 [Streptomyces phage WRightOn]ATW69336.1 hypothetical protein SEA_MANUEL_38 [Streptomyces phage Manuel]